MTATPVQAVQQVDRYIHSRRDADRPLVSWGLYFFLLSWITFGIYAMVVFYRRMNRAEQFRLRKQNYYDATLAFVSQYAEEIGEYATVHDAVGDTDRYVKDRFVVEHKQIRPGLWLVLSCLTLGVFWYIAVARVMRFWWQIQVTEQEFDEKLSPIMIKLNVVRYPITFRPVEELRRSFWMHFVLTIVTLGIYGVIWDYRSHTDPDKVYPEFHAVEDTVLNAVRGAGA